MTHMDREFKKWFCGSKVVDVAGEPLLVYHGTNAVFSEFKTLCNTGQGEEFALDGAFFGESMAVATEFSRHMTDVRIVVAHLSLKNPLTKVMFDDGEGVESDWRNPLSEQKIIVHARRAGHDSVIFESSLTGERYFVAFDSSQIKVLESVRVEHDAEASFEM